MAQVSHFGPYYWVSWGFGLPPGAQHSWSGYEIQDFSGLVWLPRRTQSRRGSTPYGVRAPTDRNNDPVSPYSY